MPFTYDLQRSLPPNVAPRTMLRNLSQESGGLAEGPSPMKARSMTSWYKGSEGISRLPIAFVLVKVAVHSIFPEHTLFDHLQVHF